MASEKKCQLDACPNEVGDEKKKGEDAKLEDMVRGLSIPDVEQRCLKLCAEYLGGTWTSATDPAKDITVKRITGGLTNQLYYVGLADHVTRQSNNRSVYTDEPREVAIKFYQKKDFCNAEGNNERLNDTIIGLLTSQLDIGPKVYGIFDDGIIQGYYKHVRFQSKHQQNDRLLRMLMHKLARIHSLEVPIEKHSMLFQDDILNKIKSAYFEMDFPQKMIEYKLELFKKHNLLEELNNYRNLISSVSTPLVFCHSDFYSGNIMVTEGEESDVIICDYEYACYGLRGFDFGGIIYEWGIDDWMQRLFTVKDWEFPSPETLEKLARFYLEGWDIVQPGYSTQPGNSIDDVIKDIKIGTLQFAIFLFSFLFNMPDVEGKEFDLKESLDMFESVYYMYWKIKQQLIQEGIIPKSN